MRPAVLLPPECGIALAPKLMSRYNSFPETPQFLLYFFPGGIYIDLDTIAVNSFDPLRKYSAAQGADYFYSLANGILIGAPQNLFHLLFYLSYLTYNPKVPLNICIERIWHRQNPKN